MNSPTEIIRRTTCRVCGSSDLTHLFTLGNQYVSDFVPEDKVGTGIKCLISLQLCNNCTLVQQEYTAPQDFLYTRHYWYKSGTTETMRNALQDVVDAAIKQVELKSGDIVLDIGANDGQLLKGYKDLDVVRVAVEPAKNMWRECDLNCEVLIRDFWSSEKYFDRTGQELDEDIDGYKAKIITACGMFYDLEDPNQFIADVAKVLHPEGVFVAQLMCLKQTIEQGDVGNFAHEHLEFYSLHSLEYLCYRNGLTLGDVEENNINGGSYRIFAYPIGSKLITEEGKKRVKKYKDVEKDMRLHYAKTYSYFSQRIEENKKKLLDFLKEARIEDKSTFVYGASTKGNVLLQYWGIDNTLVKGAVDKSLEKVGKYTLGSGLCIWGEQTVQRHFKPDYLLVLPYAFINEFCVREREFLMRGGKFIVPLPEPHTIEADETDLAVKSMWYPLDRMPLLKVRKL